MLTRKALLASALSLALAGVTVAATRSTAPGVATVTASGQDRSLSLPETEVPIETTTSTSIVTATTSAPTATPTKPRPPAAPSVLSSNAATGTVLTPAEEGIWVLDTVTGTLRKAAERGPFDVVGSTLFVAHGKTVSKQPIADGAAQTVLTVEGANELEWIEMSPTGHLLTEWMNPIDAHTAYLYRSLVDPAGHVINNDLGDNKLEWSRDGAYFVVVDYRGIRALKADGTAMWGPVPTPEKYPNDMEFTPDGKHVVIVFGHYKTYAFDVASHEWTKLPVQGTVSMADNGQFATQPLPPEGWDGFKQLGTIVTDLSGNATPLTRTGSEATLSPTGEYALYLDEALQRVGTMGNYTYRLATRDGRVLYTLSHPGWEWGRDEMRSGNAQGAWLEGPQWSSDGRYVAVGLYDPRH